MKHHFIAPILIVLALFACSEASEQSVAEDALMTMTSSTTTSSTAGGAADECVLPGSRRVPRLAYQIGACAWAAGVIASGNHAIDVCCTDAMNANCQSARTWVGLSNQYFFDRCWRRMSCGEINGLLLWFSTKKTLFANLARWCGDEDVEESTDYEYE